MLKLDLVEISNIPARNLAAAKYIKKTNNSVRKKLAIRSFLIGCVIGLIISIASIKARACEIDENDLRIVEMTYYLPTRNVCANGKYPRKGIVAFQREYIGYTALIYSCDNEGVGSLIGIYEIYDTGFGREELNGNGTIQNGNCVDIFVESDEQGKELIKKYGNKVMIQLVNGKG